MKLYSLDICLKATKTSDVARKAIFFKYIGFLTYIFILENPHEWSAQPASTLLFPKGVWKPRNPLL